MSLKSKLCARSAAAAGQRPDWPRRLTLVVGAVLVIAVLPARATDAESTSGGEWGGYNKTLDGQRFSPLAQITPANADGLKEICRVQVARNGAFQAGLIVVKGTMYATTPTETLAIDPTTCAVKWRHSYQRTHDPSLQVNRGVAYFAGRVFRGTDDGHVIALNADTGKALWDDVIGDSRLGEFVSAAPAVWNGIVIVGVSGSEFGIRGRVLGLDAASGRELWRFDTIPLKGEVGADSWKDTDWAAHGGGGTWTSVAIDPVTAEVFIPVGNPVPDFEPADRLGQNLFTNCVVVLDARSGKLKWWYQLAPSDALDHDLGAAPMLYRDSAARDRVAVAGKDGLLHLIDRATHAALSKTPITTVDAKPAPATVDGAEHCPGVAGGAAWNGPAFDPTRMTIFTGAIDFCTVFHPKHGDQYGKGTLYFGGTWSPGATAASGWITATDADTGKLRWKYHAPAPVLGGVTPTAGGVVFAGDNLGHFYVFDSASGAVVKQFDTGGSVSGGVISYEEAGRQYVAFTSGNVSRTMYGALGRPSIVVLALKNPPDAAKARAAGPDIANGQRLYGTNCFICHGGDGKNIAGADLTATRNHMNQEALVAWIKNPAPPMPKVFAEPLDQEDEWDIRDIAAFVEQWR